MKNKPGKIRISDDDLRLILSTMEYRIRRLRKFMAEDDAAWGQTLDVARTAHDRLVDLSQRIRNERRDILNGS